MKYQQDGIMLQPLKQHATISKETPYLASTLIGQHSWSELLRLLQKCRNEIGHQEINVRDTNSTFLMRSEILAHDDISNAQNVLHYACQNQAPAQIIYLLQKVDNRFACQIDNKGRTPLHFAAACGASDDAISILLREFPVAARMQDKFGKTPLILACSKAGNDALCGTNERRNETSSCSPSARVLRKLCTACGTAIISEDDEEMSALEYAIVNALDSKIVSSLQKASSKTQRKLFRTRRRRLPTPVDERWDEFGEGSD